MAKLKQLGEQARPQLEAAAKENDPEVSHAANVLLKNINRAQIVVTVVGPDDKPLPEVDVFLNLSRVSGGRMLGFGKAQSIKTDKDGNAFFSDIDPDMYFVNVGATAKGFLPANLGKANQKLGVGRNEFRLACQKGGSIKGVLLTVEKTPMAGRRVVICHPHFIRFKTNKNFAQIVAAQRGVETDEKGAFVFDALFPMEYFIAVVDGDKVLYTSNTLKVSGDQPVDVGEIVTEIKAESLVQKEKDSDKPLVKELKKLEAGEQAPAPAKADLNAPAPKPDIVPEKK
ncbi:MAG: carboxypeptidase regulatory-like domain-containing protein [Planctomycetes bacterium]|nr:carboxypeptidase regulatory-like domain-containing protein [Planctomycetota bacterium]